MSELGKTYKESTLLVAAAFLAAATSQQAIADQVFVDDVIVDGSQCVGQDCVNGENFGFDVQRLKENNLRIHFDDTSASASFPGNDWRLNINDSSNGGANYFAIEDSTAGTTPFRVNAGAGNNAVYVSDSGGNVGLGTSSPVVELHVTDGDSPTMRLEQNGANGWTPQTWDVAGNETNFFVRDVTNGSKLPFKIKSGSPDNSLVIESSGASVDKFNSRINVVSSTMANATIRLQSTESGKAQIWNAGVAGSVGTFFNVQNEATGGGMQLGADGSMVIASSGSALNLFMDGSGTATFTGDVNAVAFNATSSRTKKHNFKEIDVNEVLDTVAGLPITQWNYKRDGDTVAHVGPMAEDFFQAFGLGTDEKHIATVDSDGIALASIQALHQKHEQKDQQIAGLTRELKQRDHQLEALADKLAHIEKMLNQRNKTML